MLFLTALLVSMIITILLMPFCRGVACNLHAMDLPNARKIHDTVVPKCGGIAMAFGIMTPIVLWASMTPFSKAVIYGSLVLILLGIVDDVKDLGFKSKFTGQLGAALIAVWVGGIKISSVGFILPGEMMMPDWISIPFTIFCIIGVTNATNLADGLDGLAGGISLLIFICIGYFGFIKGDMGVVLFAVATIGAILGFLRFNSHPAQLFMGDAGSQLLGYIAIVLSLKLTQSADGLSSVLPLFFIGLPIVDTITVMVKRMAQGKPPFVADKKHFHHQLIGMGFYHSEAVLSIYLIQALYITFAMTMQRSNEWYLLGVYILYSASIVAFFQVVEKRRLRINRQKFLNPFKARLRVFKERGILIKYCFRIVRIGVPSLFLFTCLIPTPQLESYYFFVLGFLIIITITWLFKNALVDQVTKLGLYVVTPFIVYAGDQGINLYMGDSFALFYNTLYAVLFIFLLLTLNLTRRKTRFKYTPLDFLLFLSIILIFSLPNTAIIDYQMGLVAAKTVILFFGYEILVGELQQRSKRISMASLIMLMLVGIKGLVSVGYFL